MNAGSRTQIQIDNDYLIPHSSDTCQTNEWELLYGTYSSSST